VAHTSASDFSNRNSFVHATSFRFGQAVAVSFAGGMIATALGGAMFFLAFSVGLLSADGCPVQWLGGDSIGPHADFTSNTGGFTAVRTATANLGQPAVLVALPPRHHVSELRAVVFSIPPSSGALRFDQFDYRLDVWPAAAYFAGSDPLIRLSLGQPANPALAENERGEVVPEAAFGTAGPAGGDAPTYDLRFRLDPLALPLTTGLWVFGFQSWHDPWSYGSLRLAGSSAVTAAIPLFSRDGVPGRGILGGQDPVGLKLTWGFAVGTKTPSLGSSFVESGVAPEEAFRWWQLAFGAICSAAAHGDLNSDDRVDGIDLLIWQRIVDTAVTGGSTRPVPEPVATGWMALILMSAVFGRCQRGWQAIVARGDNKRGRRLTCYVSNDRRLGARTAPTS